FLYPFFFLISVAFKSNEDYVRSNALAPPSEWTLDHLQYAWEGANLGTALLNSLIAVSVGVAACVVISATAAFWFLRHGGRIAACIRFTVLGIWILPTVVY